MIGKLVFFGFAFSLSGARGSDWVPGEFVASKTPNSWTKIYNRTPLEDDIFLRELKTQRRFLKLEPNWIYRGQAQPSDQDFSKQWGLDWIAAPRAWDLHTGSASVVVAVIDTGLDFNQTDFTENLWVNKEESQGQANVDDDGNGYIDDLHGWNFVTGLSNPQDDHGHGTHCATQIGAKEGGQGFVGVNWNVKIMPLKFLDQHNSGTLEAALSAVDYAVQNGAAVISASWGSFQDSEILKEAFVRAQAAGVLVVAAVGNNPQGLDIDDRPFFPASYELPNILSVAASDKAGELASFSNFGYLSADVAAPGVDIWGYTPQGPKSMSGTSMAAPLVAGAAALLRGAHPNLSTEELRETLIKSVERQSSLKNRVWSGGVINIDRAVRGVFNPVDPSDPSKWSLLPVVFKSSHPYDANQNLEFSVDVPEAKKVSFYVSRVDLDSSHDKLSVYGEGGEWIADITGPRRRFWTQSFSGHKFTLKFRSDEHNFAYGFEIRRISYVR